MIRLLSRWFEGDDMTITTRDRGWEAVVGAAAAQAKATTDTPLDEMREFPWGKKDDQVDALVRAFTTLTTRPRSPGPLAVSIFNR